MQRYAIPVHTSDPAPAAALDELEQDAAKSAAGGRLKRLPKESLRPHSHAWHLASLGFPQLWRHGAGDGVTIALLDSGVAPDNIWLRDATVARLSVFPGDPGFDATGHGTQCAGLLGGQLGAICFGIAPRARIASIRVVDDHGFLAEGGFERALDLAMEAGAHVISVSLAVEELSDRERAAFEDVIEDGKAIVVAATENRAHAPALFPAALPGVLGVGAVTRALQPFPPWPEDRPFMPLATYGERLLTTAPQANLTLFSGTSAAVPLIAGTAANLLSQARDDAARRQRIPVVARLLADASRGQSPWRSPPVLLNANHAVGAMAALLGTGR